MSPQKTTPAADSELENLPAGAEVDETLVDDNEADEIAAREAEAAEKGEAPPSRDELLADVRKAMQEAEPDGETPAPAKTEGDAPAGDGKPPAAAETPAEAAPDADAEAAKVDAEKAEAEKAETEKAETERKAAVDQEADKLNLKGRSRERFHELNRQVAEATAANEVITKTLTDLKITGQDGKVLPLPEAAKVLTDRIKAHEEFEDAIFSTGVTSDDFKNVAAYKHAINSDNPALWEEGRKFLMQELNWLETERMGLRPKEGGVDAFTLHKDLVAGVESGELDVKYANELAEARNLRIAASKAQETRTADAGKATVAQEATTKCAEFGAELSAAEPAVFAAKWPELKGKLAEIQKNHPPEQWRDQMELAYYRIKAPAAAAPARTAAVDPVETRRPIKPGALPRAGARRPSAERGNVERSNDDETPMEALRRGMGLAD